MTWVTLMYEDIDADNLNKKYNILIAFDDTIADMLNNKNLIEK